MPKRENLIGQKFSHLTVIELDEEKTKEKKKSYWICECDCENHTRMSVLASNLKRGNSTKCKYCRAENLIGRTFGRLTVIHRYIDEQDHVQWECQCECGNSLIIRGDSLKSGHTKSCGCLQKEKVGQLKLKDFTGQKFGKLTAIKRSERKDSNGQYYWYCDCECGTKNIEISGNNLTSGHTGSCGCVKSHGEEKIAQILSKYNILFQREYRISNFIMSTGGSPRFDFAILNSDNTVKYFIEYHGEQHWIARGNIFTQEKVNIIQQRDMEKEKYCIDNNIPLIIIPYTHFNDIILEDLQLETSKYTTKEKHNAALDVMESCQIEVINRN